MLGGRLCHAPCARGPGRDVERSILGKALVSHGRDGERMPKVSGVSDGTLSGDIWDTIKMTIYKVVTKGTTPTFTVPKTVEQRQNWWGPGGKCSNTKRLAAVAT